MYQNCNKKKYSESQVFEQKLWHEHFKTTQKKIKMVPLAKKKKKNSFKFHDIC